MTKTGTARTKTQGIKARTTRKSSELLPAKKIPPLTSVAETADWYDSHDTSELSLPPATDEVPSPSPTRLETVAIRLSLHEIDELRKRAARLGIGYTTYIRMLVNRHVLDERPLS